MYRDDRERDDLKTVEDALSAPGRDIDFGFSDRALFALDDTNILQPDQKSNPRLPTGCDGHGTAVASVAAAKAGNKEGVAGVAYDVPLIGLRAGEYWDRPGRNKQAKDDRIEDARATSVNWWSSQAQFTAENVIHQLEIVKALQVPVLNMSYGQNLFKAGGRAGAPPVVNQPALTEAWLRTLATGKTLGVAGAGNEAEQYGSGSKVPPGTGEHAPQAPCGINLIRVEGAVVPDPEGKKFEKFSAVAFPGPSRDADWGDVNLLCVAASWQYGSRLAPFSGRGDAAVDLAAPGHEITMLARPVVRDGEAKEVYQVADGTSYAAPMVAGAAALLREAAPGAPIREIKRALRSGARGNPWLGDGPCGPARSTSPARFVSLRNVPNRIGILSASTTRTSPTRRGIAVERERTSSRPSTKLTPKTWVPSPR